MRVFSRKFGRPPASALPVTLPPSAAHGSPAPRFRSGGTWQHATALTGWRRHDGVLTPTAATPLSGARIEARPTPATLTPYPAPLTVTPAFVNPRAEGADLALRALHRPR
ncbi:hypothetical protein J7F01_16335 [Streptomyces sp. ISL-22]|uniref:hypothetical protein n=1 Tax=unclassified Streptomyces TaxID=2593676 RepID=UPI001BE5C830|nr:MULTISPECIES: hypothetical protein [unclassified Streptomyces]MBT2416569.1 hypothetical protein [Streptomyces sp. ISL-24]MBT2433722.1 hypothetical protein [Streptomyces sp. ISL-22]